MHPNSLANLKPPYKPGENGHQGGYSLKARLLHQLDKPLVKPKPDAPVGEHIVYATLRGALACEPTVKHLQEVWNRVEGKVEQPVVGAILGDIHIEVEFVNRKEIEVIDGIDGRSQASLPEGMGSTDPG